MIGIIQSLIHRSRTALANGLMGLILILHGEHVTCDSLEDTAEMSEDGKSMIINFVFCGTLRKIRIAFDRKQISNNTFVIRDKDGVEIERFVSSVPGLDDIIFSKTNLTSMFPELSEIEVLEDDDY